MKKTCSCSDSNNHNNNHNIHPKPLITKSKLAGGAAGGVGSGSWGGAGNVSGTWGAGGGVGNVSGTWGAGSAGGNMCGSWGGGGGVGGGVGSSKILLQAMVGHNLPSTDHKSILRILTAMWSLPPSFVVDAIASSLEMMVFLHLIGNIDFYNVGYDYVLCSDSFVLIVTIGQVVGLPTLK